MQYLFFIMDFGFIKEHFYLLLITITIPVYWLITYLLKKLNVKSYRARAVISFILTTIIIILIGILVALKGFIMSHSIPGI